MTSDGTLTAACAEQLRHEETLLTAALPFVRAVHDEFARHNHAALLPLLAGHQELTRSLSELHGARQRFRALLAGRPGISPQQATLARALAELAAADRAALAPQVERIRQSAADLAATNYRVSIYLRIHLDAYRRILRDLTRTGAGSGRYGREGKAETPEYRPMIHIHG